MNQRKELSTKVKRLIVAAVANKVSYSQAAAQYGCSKSAVQHLMARYNKTGSTDNKKRAGRPKVTTEREDRIQKKIDPRKTSTMLKVELGEKYQLDCSFSTVKRRLRQNNLFGRRPAKKPLISAKNRLARLKFAKKHLNWSVQQWSKVVWSDESKFMLFGSDGIRYVRRPVGERFNPKFQLPTVKHGGGNVMIWGCFSRDLVGPIHRIEGIMDQNVYADIITNIMLVHAKDKMPRGWIFQQDNDPKHTAKSVKALMNKKKIRLLEWPSQSPDLNPIEHLWEHLDRQLKDRKPSNQNDLFCKIQEAWKQIKPETLINLVDSMPRRCQAVIDAKGYPTKY